MIDPDWAGRVKVTLDDHTTGARAAEGEEAADDDAKRKDLDRSYYRDELELADSKIHDSDSDDGSHDGEETDERPDDDASGTAAGMPVVHPLGLCVGGIAAKDSIGIFKGGPFCGSDETDGANDADNLVVKIDGERRVKSLESHELTDIDAAQRTHTSDIIV